MQRALALLAGLSLLAAACTNATSPLASVAPTSDCRPLALRQAELEGGFFAPIGPPARGTAVDAVLAVGGDGPMLAGRTLRYAFTLGGPAPMVGPSVDLAAVEATGSAVGAEACSGTVRLAYPGGTGWAKSGGWMDATLDGLEIRAADGPDCTAMELGDDTFGLECPRVGVRAGDQATSGTLWLRWRSAESPTELAALPAWVLQLAGAAVATDAPLSTPEPGSVTGTVTIDGLERPVVEGSVAMTTSLGHRNYLVTLQLGEDGGVVRLGIPEFTGAGTWTGSVGYDVVRQFDDGEHTVYHVGQGCTIEVGEGGLTGETTCALDRDYDGSLHPSPVTVEVTWSASTVVDLIGDNVVITWRLGASMRSEGQAMVAVDLSSTPDPGLLILPEVPLERTEAPAILRLRILGYTGDGTYTGSAVDPAIDVLADSPLLVPARAPDPEAQPWAPILGSCLATVTQAGRSGTMSCPGDPSFPKDDPLGGSVTLFATWQFVE